MLERSLMAVTHGYKPSPAKDFILFLAAFSVTAIYFLSTAFKPWLPYFYVLMWALYTLYLLYFHLVSGACRRIPACAGDSAGGRRGTIALKYDFFRSREMARRWSL
ncbi:hypothetical protein J4732_10485 [Serratia marcescens]|uniref:Uncharacterized protein n=1 Tax=Serratia marcescens TaxID=615 RepID=A0A939NJW3_SERMA|nr:hypothetical protein [Serratia marcescens]